MDTALSEQGRGTARHMWINARHSRGTAWARHGHGMGTAWAWHGHGMGTPWARHGHGMDTTWVRHGHGMGTAWTRHAMCESAFKKRWAQRYLPSHKTYYMVTNHTGRESQGFYGPSMVPLVYLSVQCVGHVAYRARRTQFGVLLAEYLISWHL
jgi:hypothetical protein